MKRENKGNINNILYKKVSILLCSCGMTSEESEKRESERRERESISWVLRRITNGLLIGKCLNGWF